MNQPAAIPQTFTGKTYSIEDGVTFTPFLALSEPDPNGMVVGLEGTYTDGEEAIEVKRTCFRADKLTEVVDEFIWPEFTFSERTFWVNNGSLQSLFFVESEPDKDGFCRGTLAIVGPEDYHGQPITNYEQATYHTDDLNQEALGVGWPKEVTD